MYIDLEYSRLNFERRLFGELSNGNARNVTERAMNARIDVVKQVYEKDGFAEYTQDAFKIILGSDDDSDE